MLYINYLLLIIVLKKQKALEKSLSLIELLIKLKYNQFFHLKNFCKFKLILNKIKAPSLFKVHSYIFVSALISKLMVLLVQLKSNKP